MGDGKRNRKRKRRNSRPPSFSFSCSFCFFLSLHLNSPKPRTMRNGLICHTSILVCCLLVLTAAQSQVQKIYVHPKAVGTAKQSQFVDSIRFIPLEVKDGIETGAYSNIDVTEKYFLVTDYPNKTLVVYGKDGNFVKKINFKKLGQSFYPDYNENTNRVVFLGTNKNYTLTSKDALQIRLDWNNPRNKKYYKKYVIDLNDTSFAIQKDVPDENDILRAYHYYDDFYWSGAINTSPLYEDTLDYEHHHNRDRKSTRLNSSHMSISYAVFCLKKKKK